MNHQFRMCRIVELKSSYVMFTDSIGFGSKFALRMQRICLERDNIIDSTTRVANL